MERLPWAKTAENEFIARPEGEGTEPYVRVWRSTTGTWMWSAQWSGRFSRSSHAESAKIASIDATVAWHAMVAQPIPRDVEGEISAIVATIETDSLPQTLLQEDNRYLERLIRALSQKYYGTELNPPPAPEPVMRAFDLMSRELFRRAKTGE